MKALATGLFLLIALSGCWDNEKDRKAKDFMSTLTKCDNCKLEKPFLGSGQSHDKEKKAATDGR